MIGAGVAGIVTSYLLSRKHDVTLIEANKYIGGHTNTIDTEDENGTPLRVDTGFIVLNDKTYPNLHKFLQNIEVPVRYSDMSFGYECRETGLQYSGRGVKGLFAQPGNVFSPRYLKFLNDIRRFCSIGLATMTSSTIDSDITVREFCMEHNLNEYFQRHYLIPMAAAIWSAPDDGIREFPIRTLLSFFDNHGLLAIADRPRWQTVVGGSKSYVERFLEQFNGTVFTDSPVESVKESDSGVTVTLGAGESLAFDLAVVALHADKALQVLAEPTELQRRLLSPWEYQLNKTYLHDDASFLPPKKMAHASWNYRRTTDTKQEGGVYVTYHMNRLQGLTCKREFLVTLNPVEEIKEEHIIREINYDHPIFSSKSVGTQDDLPKLNKTGKIQFCGSYFGYGFHEDAVRSATEVGKLWGESL